MVLGLGLGVLTWAFTMRDPKEHAAPFSKPALELRRNWEPVVREKVAGQG